MEQPPAANPPPPVEPLQPSAQLWKCKLQNEGEGETQSYYDIEIQLGESAIIGDFDLEKAVCSHGLFMMAPNRWDPVTKSLIRPLRLGILPYHGGESVVVRVSHRQASSPSSLLVRVLGVESLTAREEEAVVVQVRRMLRLSESEEIKVREFQRVHDEAKKRGFGRVFRSPTLFEDMVKCILLCNCQWSRTLNMAKALCELQFELRLPSSKQAHGDLYTHSEAFIPPTPVGKERRKRRKLDKISRALFRAESMGTAASETDKSSRIEPIKSTNRTDLPEKLTPSSISYNLNSKSHEQRNGCESSIGINVKTTNSPAIGNFPSPEELVGLGELYLAKRCNVGYRAGRILNLARVIVEGRIQLSQLEELCSEASSSSYQEIDDKLKKINGFGPFTRGNVLMCMGFYNVIPTDSETIRHLKQVHSRITTSESVQKAVEEIYGAFEPFQFLAYWSEVWNFYEEWFGKLSEMPSSDYGRITASNMKVQKLTSRRR